jgi:hypothetical protein
VRNVSNYSAFDKLCVATLFGETEGNVIQFTYLSSSGFYHWVTRGVQEVLELISCQCLSKLTMSQLSDTLFFNLSLLD